ncbi:MAG: PDDEXK nuclease domain-containing protein [Bacteroidales bacterium]|jgi:predicted nuclease of restriction endonuclease-like (RecB) superfamily|nr:PDDEXK nuclease domain-containing protein [Bacteroidales bacterium]
MSKIENDIQQKEFADFIHAVGSEIEQAQVKLISAANVQMLLHYWKMGHFILFAQKKLGWGGKVIEKISNAIRIKYPEKKGYSPRNLGYMSKFAKLYSLDVLKQMHLIETNFPPLSVENILQITKTLNEYEIVQEPPAQLEEVIGQQVVAQIQSVDLEKNTILQEVPAKLQNDSKTLSQIPQDPLAKIEQIFADSPIAKINWASHMILMDNKLPLGKKYWYMKEQLEQGWSSNILGMQIEMDAFKRQIDSKKVNNFTAVLPKPHSDFMNYLQKDPYIFDTAGTKDRADERDVEEQLVTHVTKYLLEMGDGFAFVARQKHFEVGGKDFFADLILYNFKLRAFVVVELKATPFKPEYVGQLNFYVNVVNDMMKGEHDNKTIGLLLCKGKNEVVAQYALDTINQPLGVSDYQLSKAVPEDLKSTLPSIEEVEQELSQFLKEKN